MKEVLVVMEQIRDILNHEVNGRKIKQSDIGVVTPYRLQCKIIGRFCHKLGQEKPVMIVSTVRTGGVLGFIDSAQVIILYCPLFAYFIGKVCY